VVLRPHHLEAGDGDQMARTRRPLLSAYHAQFAGTMRTLR
jgi:hypothetical protein